MKICKLLPINSLGLICSSIQLCPILQWWRDLHCTVTVYNCASKSKGCFFLTFRTKYKYLPFQLLKESLSLFVDLSSFFVLDNFSNNLYFMTSLCINLIDIYKHTKMFSRKQPTIQFQDLYIWPKQTESINYWYHKKMLKKKWQRACRVGATNWEI